MYWTYEKKYLFNNTKNSIIFSRNFISFFKKPKIALKTPVFFKKHTKILKENINKRIEHSFLTYKKNSGHINKTFTTVWLGKETFIHFLPINLVVKKTLIIANSTKKKQFLFLLKEYCQSLIETQKNLLKETFNFKSIIISNKNFYNKEKAYSTLIYKEYFSYYFFNMPLNYEYSAWSPTIKSIKYNKICTILIQAFFNNLLTKNNILFNTTEILTACITKKKHIYTKNFLKINLAQAKIQAFFHGRNNNNILNSFTKKNILNTKTYLWKQANNFSNNNLINYATTTKKNYFPLHAQRQYIFGKNVIIKRNKTRKTITPRILYILLRLEEKIELYTKNVETALIAKEYLALYNALQHKILQQQNNAVSTNILLTNLNEILKIKNNDWKILILPAINNWLKQRPENSAIKTQKFFNILWSKIENQKEFTRANKIIDASAQNNNISLTYNINNTTNLFAINPVQNITRKNLSVRKFLTQEKLVLPHTKYNFKNNKIALSRLTNRTIKIFFINALSLTKYAFNLEREYEKKEKRSPTTFLQNIDRDLINKYKYIAIYIKDLIRICFIGMYLKKTKIIADFIAFQLGKLPRNRKETSFIRFIIKVVKTFAAEREEILGLRIKFSGRVNRWRRTKAIIGERGVIPLHTINNQIEYGTAHAVNRKGAVGIRIWIHYNNTFNTILKESILKYFNYSKRLAIKKNFLKTTKFLKK